MNLYELSRKMEATTKETLEMVISLKTKRPRLSIGDIDVPNEIAYTLLAQKECARLHTVLEEQRRQKEIKRRAKCFRVGDRVWEVARRFGTTSREVCSIIGMEWKKGCVAKELTVAELQLVKTAIKNAS